MDGGRTVILVITNNLIYQNSMVLVCVQVDLGELEGARNRNLVVIIKY